MISCVASFRIQLMAFKLIVKWILLLLIEIIHKMVNWNYTYHNNDDINVRYILATHIAYEK
jgi:hypothetical protein